MELKMRISAQILESSHERRNHDYVAITFIILRNAFKFIRLCNSTCAFIFSLISFFLSLVFFSPFIFHSLLSLIPISSLLFFLSSLSFSFPLTCLFSPSVSSRFLFFLQNGVAFKVSLMAAKLPSPPSSPSLRHHLKNLIKPASFSSQTEHSWNCHEQNKTPDENMTNLCHLTFPLPAAKDLSKNSFISIALLMRAPARWNNELARA